MKETSKAMRRRWCEDALGHFTWRKIFRGPALDIGSGDDPLPAPEDCRHFDKKDGDANWLADYFAPKSFALIHASQVLEHMENPRAALLEWLPLLKPGGHLCVTVPSWELYEHCRPRSQWNPDHRATFSTLNRKGGGVLPHYFMPDDLLHPLPPGFRLKFCRLLATNYDFKTGGGVDQSLLECEFVEPWVEFLVERTR